MSWDVSFQTRLASSAWRLKRAVGIHRNFVVTRPRCALFWSKLACVIVCPFGLGNLNGNWFWLEILEGWGMHVVWSACKALPKYGDMGNIVHQPYCECSYAHGCQRNTCLQTRLLLNPSNYYSTIVGPVHPPCIHVNVYSIHTYMMILEWTEYWFVANVYKCWHLVRRFEFPK